MDTRFNKNETILGVLVLTVAFQVLAHGDGLLDQVVKIFRDLGSHTVSLKDTDNLVASNSLDLRNAVRITKDNTNLSRRKTLLGVLADQVNNFLRAGLQPGRSRATIGEGTVGDTLTTRILVDIYA